MSLKTLIRASLIFGGVYLLGDGLIHLLNLRLADVSALWPLSALAYSTFVSQLYGSFVLFVSLVVFEVQRDVEKYKQVITFMGVWSIFHAVYLFWKMISNFSADFGNIPSLNVWLPYYDFVIGLETGLLFMFGILTLVWRKRK